MSWSDRPRYRAKREKSGSATDGRRDGWLIPADLAWSIIRAKGLVKNIAWDHKVSQGAVIAIRRGKRVPEVYRQYHAARETNACLISLAFTGQ